MSFELIPQESGGFTLNQVGGAQGPAGVVNGNLPTSEPLEIGEPWIDENGFVKISLGTTNLFHALGFTDSDYFSGPSNEGLDTIGTVRFIGKLLSVPPNGQKIIFGRSSGFTGWYVATGVTASGTLEVVGNSTVYGLAATFVTADIGKAFCMHSVIRSGELVTYFGGIETHRASITPTAANSGTNFTIGRFAPATSYSNEHLSVIDIATSQSPMTPAQILADAKQIQSRTANLRILDIPNQLHRFNADDSASTWASRTGVLALTKNGTPTRELY